MAMNNNIGLYRLVFGITATESLYEEQLEGKSGKTWYKVKSNLYGTLGGQVWEGMV